MHSPHSPLMRSFDPGSYDAEAPSPAHGPGAYGRCGALLKARSLSGVLNPSVASFLAWKGCRCEALGLEKQAALEGPRSPSLGKEGSRCSARRKIPGLSDDEGTKPGTSPGQVDDRNPTA